MYPMKYMPVPLPYYACALCLCAAFVLTIVACGCTQPLATSAQTSSGVSVTKPDNSHITVAFIGAPGKEQDAVDRIAAYNNTRPDSCNPDLYRFLQRERSRVYHWILF